MSSKAISSTYDDIWLVAGTRTPFADYQGALREVSPTDLGIFAARALFAASGIPAADVDVVIGGNVAQSSFDAYYLPRHIGLYAGVPLETPALLVHRLCGTGFEAILTAADQIALGKAELALCVGAESMSRNPLATYTQRSGFKLGQPQFGDFLWESTLDTATDTRMGDTAENLARQYGITREQCDRFAESSFARAAQSAASGYFDGEITAVTSTQWQPDGYQPRALNLPRKIDSVSADEHVRATPYAVLEKLRPAFKGVQTGGNSSAIVDGAAAVLVASGAYVRAHGLQPLARIVAGSVVGVPPAIMGIGPAPAIRAVLDKARMGLGDVGRFEINEAFAAQYLAVEQELGLDRDKVNRHGGAIAIGHPLAVSGLRLTHTVARQLQRDGQQFGVASACAGGGQGIAILLERA